MRSNHKAEEGTDVVRYRSGRGERGKLEGRHFPLERSPQWS